MPFHSTGQQRQNTEGDVILDVSNVMYAEQCRRTRRQQQQHLWQFLLETLSNPNYNPCYIEWLDRAQGIFRFVESQKVARLWGIRRRRANMSYEYLSRAMRSLHLLPRNYLPLP